MKEVGLTMGDLYYSQTREEAKAVNRTGDRKNREVLYRSTEVSKRHSNWKKKNIFNEGLNGNLR